MRRLLLTLAAFLLLSAPAEASWSWPVRGDVITQYRNGDDPYAGGQHRGIDIAAAVGTPVVAAAGGEVRFAGTAGSSGLTVSVRTADGFDTSYLHLSALAVRAGTPGRRWRAPGRGRNDRHALRRPTPPALRRARGGHATRLRRPALDAAARRGAPTERGATPSAGAGAAGASARAGTGAPRRPTARTPQCSSASARPSRRATVRARPARRASGRARAATSTEDHTGAGTAPRATVGARPAVLAGASGRARATISTENRTGAGPARRRPARAGAVIACGRAQAAARRSPCGTGPVRPGHRLGTRMRGPPVGRGHPRSDRRRPRQGRPR